ncbi:phosphate transporter PHO1 homolog 10 isoform X4 [Cryptomeria japonica]|uniref:phosphate transporter PHO1 homolog 10 isoform X4 n=1 Tax=Cryptomeria japonica TaxID=3369 RepID=UPI0027D9D91F|nr:phosphate transporter PHO1 homolog 10 isoform X4 [Cryptomeria japonica]
MKFGKEFIAQLIPEWQTAYLDYIFLKSMLKDIRKSKEKKRKKSGENSGGLKKTGTLGRTFTGLMRRHSPRKLEEEVILVKNMQHDGKDSYETMFLMAAEEGAEFDIDFFNRLDLELNKVNTFYRNKVEDILDEAALLDKQMNSLIALKAILRDPDKSKHSVHLGTTQPSQELTTATSMLNRNKERYNGSAHKEVINEIEMSSDHSFQEFGTQRATLTSQQLEPVKVVRNVKINIMPETPRSTFRSILSDSQTKHFSKEDLDRGKQMLRAAFIEFHRKLWLVKSFSSLNLLAFSKIMKKYDKITGKQASRSYLDVVEKSYLGSCEEVGKLLGRVESTFTKYFTNGNHRNAMQVLRPLRKREKHRVTFLIGLFTGGSIALIAATVFLIRFFRIYEEGGVTQYMDAVFPLYSILGCIFLHMLMYAADIYLWVHYRINYPFIFGFKSGSELGYREILLIAMAISLFSMFGIISNLNMETKDLPTIPEVIPLILMLVLLFILVCPFKIFYYSSRIFLLRSAFRCMCAPFYKVLLPEFFLADQFTSQSIRRLVEERDPMQGYNALKYFATVVAVVMRTAYSKNSNDIWKMLSFLTSGIATFISIYWDIVIDWGLLQKNSQNPWLREKLVIGQNKIYFLAMIVNVFLRFAWMQSVLRFQIPGLHYKVTVTIFACLEIVRRGIWNFFRLENEHLNNVGKYRAFKSVPLPFQYGDGEDNH